MRKLIGFASLAIVASSVAWAHAQQPAAAKPELTKGSFMIAGLHCPPCTRTVESSLSRVQGVRSVKVDWNAKSAKIEFDESVLPAQRVGQLIAATPHMMVGTNMRYEGWLALKVPELKDDTSATKIKETLGKVAGVKGVATYPEQHVVGIQFTADGKTSSRELIGALQQAGFKASNI